VFTTLRLHLLGVALSRESLLRGNWRREPGSLLALAVVLAAGAALAWAVAPAAATLLRGGTPEAALRLVRDHAQRPAIAVALLPFTALVRPVLADWPRDFAIAALPVVGIVLLNYAWVLRAEGTLEQWAVAGERETIEGQRAPARPSYRRAPFSLAASGRAEWALVWKNLIMLGRYASPVVLLRIALPVVVLAVVLGTSGRARVASSVYPIALVIAGGLTVLGPYSLRNDLRQDLGRLAVLKTWPISGERLLWGEVLAPSIALSAVVWLLLFTIGALSLAIPPASLSWTGRLAVGLAALVVAPPLILAQVVIQNAAVVLFPGWVAIGPARPRGVEAMGQQMLMVAGTLLLLAIGVLPGLAISAGIAFVGYTLIGWLALVPAALLLSSLLVAETYVAVHFLGEVLERTDPTAVDPGS
jgi:ABC-2 type transport system permease protein